MFWSFFSHHFYSHAGSLTIIFLACYIFAMSLSFPANPSSQSWPCQRDRDVRTLLSEALIKSQTLEGKISALHSNMVNFNQRYLLSLTLLFLVLPVFSTRAQHEKHDEVWNIFLDWKMTIFYFWLLQSRQWPPNPFKATNVGFFGPQRSVNKTVLKVNIIS